MSIAPLSVAKETNGNVYNLLDPNRVSMLSIGYVPLIQSMLSSTLLKKSGVCGIE